MKSLEALRDEAAEKYAIETQEKLNAHLGHEIVPAWGPIAGAFQEGWNHAVLIARAQAIQEVSDWIYKHEFIVRNHCPANQVRAIKEHFASELSHLPSVS